MTGGSDGLNELDLSSGTSWAFANTYASGGKAACLIPLSEGNYFGAAFDGEPAFWSFKKSENVQVIRLATCSGVDFDGDQILRNAVSSFNALSPDDRIALIDYGVYNEGYDVSVGMTRLNADISAGNEPDIYDLWSLTSPNSYIAKGLIADLKPWFEKDAEFSYEDMIPSAAAAMEKDGHLFDLVPCFTVTTVFSSDERIGQARHDLPRPVPLDPAAVRMFIFLPEELCIQSKKARRVGSHSQKRYKHGGNQNHAQGLSHSIVFPPLIVFDLCQHTPLNV